MRRVVAVLALSILTAGCTTTTHGTVIAAPTLGHAPQPLSAAALPRLLLDSTQIGAIMDNSSLQIVDSSDQMYTNRPLPDGCLVWADAQDNAYRGSGWTALRVQELKDHPDNPDHIAYQAVASFPDALGANNFYASQLTSWVSCDNRRVNLQDPGDITDHYWTLSKSTNNDGILTIVRTQEGGQDWACQRALTAKNNVIIDVSACAANINNQATQITKQIATKIQ